jgi:heptosyltransferase-2
MSLINRDDIKNILVFQTAFLGDVVLSTPLFKNIKTHFKNAKVTALVIPGNSPAFEGNPHIDDIITYDKKAARKMKNFFATLKRIKTEKFDLVFSLHRSLRTSLMLYLSNIPHRIGFSDSVFSFLYTRRVKRDMSLHDVKRNLSILTGADIAASELTDDLLVTYSPDDKASLLSKMKEAGANGKQVVVVSPGSVWATKRYPHTSYSKLISILNKAGRFDVVLTGSKDDVKIADEIKALTDGHVTDLTGKTTLKELASLLDLASLMITNDSGPMHIAASFNTPIVAIFGATTRDLGFYPYNKNSVVVEKDLPCRPCGKHGGNVCPIKTFDCMNLITPDEVYAHALKLLGGA